MDRGAWQATVCGSQRVGHNRDTNTLFPSFLSFFSMKKKQRLKEKPTRDNTLESRNI